jgi:hypothetical protein
MDSTFGRLVVIAIIVLLAWLLGCQAPGVQHQAPSQDQTQEQTVWYRVRLTNTIRVYEFEDAGHRYYVAASIRNSTPMSMIHAEHCPAEHDRP